MKTFLKIKVCGMKYPENRKELELLPVDFFGFIFYRQSERFAGYPEDNDFDELTKTTRQKVGVFVNEEAAKIIEIATKASLTHIQLHGDEMPEFCELIGDNGLKTIKVFRVDERFDFNETLNYEGIAEFFLFDTKAGHPGGTGKKYNWDLLNNYNGKTPFFLSGGIKPADVPLIKSFRHTQFYGIDLNSGFEDYPGFKNLTTLKQFIDELQK